MRILVILAFLSLTPVFLAAEKAKAEENQDKNAEQKLEIQYNKKITSHNDNFIAPAYIPETVISVVKSYPKKTYRADVASKPNVPKGSFVISATAYTAAADECGKNDGITASGTKVKKGKTIACPPQYPFGTKIKISGMGTFVCEDRGGAIKGNHFDIYMKTKKEAFAFGRRKLVAKVVK